MSATQERHRLAALRRDMIRTSRAQGRARRRIATRTPQAAKTWLIDAGVSPENAARYASAFSRGVVPTVLGTTKIKPRTDSRRSERVVPVKLYGRATVARRAATYRPKNNPQAAAEFARAAEILAA